MSLTSPERRVITFYSFKGGVGRTMMLANVAYRMANKHGLRVVVVDWDLEAPGLHRFFGVSPEQAAEAHGVLDYFEAWRDALANHASKPPDVTPWLIPITDKNHKPRFGSLSLLIAGKIDGKYNSRLAALDWQEFYKQGAGASAVETLRAQLAESADVDVVLIDSRTGFTDAGGICTLQVPDGVVLMMAPNQQSLAGIGDVARAIAKAPEEMRAGREPSRMWLVVSRVPIVEETYLAEQWFETNKPWFADGLRDGLWLKEDHPEGMKSHIVPHRGRWGFDEVVLNETSKADPADLLTVPYDQFTETLLRWLRKTPKDGLDLYKGSPARSTNWADIKAMEEAAAAAERRGDILGIADSLQGLSLGLMSVGRVDEAIRKAEQASGIFLSRGSRQNYVLALNLLGWALNTAKRYDEAAQTLTKALIVAREIGDRLQEASTLGQLTDTLLGQGRRDAAAELIREAHTIAQELGDSVAAAVGTFWLIGYYFEKLGLRREAVDAMRRSAQTARQHEDRLGEEQALDYLLAISATGEHLEDADALRVRLAELKPAPATTPQPDVQRGSSKSKAKPKAKAKPKPKS